MEHKIDMVEQEILSSDNGYLDLQKWMAKLAMKSILLVGGKSMNLLEVNGYMKRFAKENDIRLVPFRDFAPNPIYESVVEGVRTFHENGCSAIIAVGGGSAIDVAKCIKLYSDMNIPMSYPKQKAVSNNIPFLAVPTTAGTGSEVTRYAVIYNGGEKQSVTDEKCIPSAILLDASALRTLPRYQRKVTMMDALCHAVESCWSMNSTEESMGYSLQAVRMVMKNKDGYLANRDDGNAGMLLAANIAGKAINITQTTAGHAMCYKLTSLYGIAHGHAAALCVSRLWTHMLAHMEKCIDPRGCAYLRDILARLSEVMGARTPGDAACIFRALVDELFPYLPDSVSEEDLDVLVSSVNSVRMKNYPVKLEQDDVRLLYQQILSRE